MNFFSAFELLKHNLVKPVPPNFVDEVGVDDLLHAFERIFTQSGIVDRRRVFISRVIVRLIVVA